MAEEEERVAKYELIERSTTLTPNPYDLLGDMLQHHPELGEANVALAWRRGWKPDKDGRLVLGQCHICSEMERNLHANCPDIIILINLEVWQQVGFTSDQQAALIDHELCHAKPRIGSDGGEVFDANGNQLYRSRKHEIEEFPEIVKRHGIYTTSLRVFAEMVIEADQSPLFPIPAGVRAAANAGPRAKIERVAGYIKTLSASEKEALDQLLAGDQGGFEAAIERLAGMPPVGAVTRQPKGRSRMRVVPTQEEAH